MHPTLHQQLFDKEALLQALAQPEQPPLFAYQKALRAGRESLEQLFHQHHAIDELVKGYAWLVDQLVTQVWQQSGLAQRSDLTLIAVGGYGRGELHPYSDVDLLILLAEENHEQHREGIESFLTTLWDLGLEIGHSVRSIKECVTESTSDITIATNLLESRILIGNAQLYTTLQDETSPDKTWSSHDFFVAKHQEQEARHEKFHHTAYNLEPNIKEGPGGLRDIQNILWVAMRHFGNNDLHELVNHGFLTENEFQTLDEGRQFLWKIRAGLHFLAKRKEDRLLFDHQRSLATAFGYQDDECRLAVEHFMKQYYRTITELERLNEMLLQHFKEVVITNHENQTITPINRRFQHRNGYLETTNDQVFNQTPFAIMELFLLLAQQEELRGVRASTVRLIRDHLDLIDEDFRNDIRCRSLFMELIRQPNGVTHQLRRMNRYGVLAAYIPSFANIVGQMQHDLFHVYTVDEHTLSVVRNLRRFTVAEYQNEFPLCSEVIQTIPKTELLYIAGLFHDIAKGRGGDHSKLGVVDTQAFCEQHDLSQVDTELVTWLVRHHLVMSVTAQKRDISDPEVVHEFMKLVGNPTKLKYLYLLTVADIRATNPEVWNNWKDALLGELYRATLNAFERSDNPESQQERIQEHKEIAMQALVDEQRIEVTAIEEMFERYSDQYFLNFLPDEIAWHTQALLHQLETGLDEIILTRGDSPKGGTEILVYTKNREGIFALITACLEQLALDITNARIMITNDGYVMDSFIVLGSDGKAIIDPAQLQTIEQALLKQLQQQNPSQPQVNLRTTRQKKHFHFPTSVTFKEDEYSDRIIMEVIAADRPGLLSTIAKCMLSEGVQLHNANIATLGEKAEDSFYISLGTPVSGNHDTLNSLAECIIEATGDSS